MATRLRIKPARLCFCRLSEDGTFFTCQGVPTRRIFHKRPAAVVTPRNIPQIDWWRPGSWAAWTRVTRARSEALRNWTQSSEATVAAQCGLPFLRHRVTTKFSIQTVVAHNITSPAARLSVDRGAELRITRVNRARTAASIQKRPSTERSALSGRSSIILSSRNLSQ